MRDLFWEYYRPSDEEFSRIWQDAIFVFDTNVLLNLYRYTPSTRDDLLKAIEALQQQIWIPHQVGLEFSRNRISVIAKQNEIGDLTKIFDTFVEEKFTKNILQKYGNRGHSFAELKKIKDIFDQTKQALQDELKRARAQHPDPRKNDLVLEHIDKHFRGKIGPPYSPDEMAKLSSEYEERYKQEIPPGFKDKHKKPADKDDYPDDPNNPGNKYGDVILWYQLIDYAKQEKCPLILVVDDVKEDWWQEYKGEKLGPRIELRQEMHKKANVLFYMYTADNFIQKAQDFLQLQIQNETIEEVREVRIQEAKQREEETQKPLYPSPTLYPSPNLYPSLELNPRVRQQIEDIKQFTIALGGPEEIKRQMRLDQQFLGQMQPSLPPSAASGEDKANQEDSELDQDNSTDDPSKE